eukprot:GHVH01005452.1.p2 GENE.GHVH01005452.1~~GHVH01005452.1.p2  ORF type:complete len:380 (+),score=38.56 GHVH01005452.1:73-1212(+)
MSNDLNGPEKDRNLFPGPMPGTHLPLIPHNWPMGNHFYPPNYQAHMNPNSHQTPNSAAIPPMLNYPLLMNDTHQSHFPFPSGREIFDPSCRPLPQWIVLMLENVKEPPADIKSLFDSPNGPITHTLRRTWSSWLQMSEGSMNQAHMGGTAYAEQMILPRDDAIASVEEVMLFLFSVGMPSTWVDNLVVATHPKSVDLEKIPIDGICYFVCNIKPQWEDEVNRRGGHFELKLSVPSIDIRPAFIDHMWIATVLAVSTAGPTVDPNGYVTGIRLIKKSPKGKTMSPAFLRLEVWLSVSDEESRRSVMHNLSKYIDDSFVNGVPAGANNYPNFNNADWRDHSDNGRSDRKKLQRGDSKGVEYNKGHGGSDRYRTALRRIDRW